MRRVRCQISHRASHCRASRIAASQFLRDEAPLLILNYGLQNYSEGDVKLPKIDWKHELVANWALLGTLITLIGLMPLVMRSTGKW